MKARTRPEQIDDILNAMNTAEMTTELEEYIADLEAKQPYRPSRITSLLQAVESSYSPEARISLEAYITRLEATQLIAAAPTSTPTLRFDPKNPPYWSHQRSVEREQRQASTMRKQNKHR